MSTMSPTLVDGGLSAFFLLFFHLGSYQGGWGEGRRRRGEKAPVRYMKIFLVRGGEQL